MGSGLKNSLIPQKLLNKVKKIAKVTLR